MLFVDLAVGATHRWSDVAAAWRHLPPGVVDACSGIFVRSPVVHGVDDEGRTVTLAGPADAQWPADVSRLKDGLERVHAGARLPRRSMCAFELPLGKEPVIAGGAGDDALVYLARCRNAELSALLENNGAIWKPATYHYRLPSGHHAGTFVRIADVFRDPRAATVLASWLRGAIGEQTIVVLDSGTIMPVVDQLDLLVKRAGRLGLFGTLAFDRFPRSRFEYLRQLKGTHGTDVLALLSVSSSGRTYRLL